MGRGGNVGAAAVVEVEVVRSLNDDPLLVPLNNPPNTPLAEEAAFPKGILFCIAEDPSELQYGYPLTLPSKST